jgi:hypothetical protein
MWKRKNSCRRPTDRQQSSKRLPANRCHCRSCTSMQPFSRYLHGPFQSISTLSTKRFPSNFPFSFRSISTLSTKRFRLEFQCSSISYHSSYTLSASRTVLKFPFSFRSSVVSSLRSSRISCRYSQRGGILRLKIDQSPGVCGVRSTRGIREYNEDRFQRCTIRLGGDEVVYCAVFDGYESFSEIHLARYGPNSSLYYNFLHN